MFTDGTVSVSLSWTYTSHSYPCLSLIFASLCAPARLPPSFPHRRKVSLTASQHHLPTITTTTTTSHPRSPTTRQGCPGETHSIAFGAPSRASRSTATATKLSSRGNFTRTAPLVARPLLLALPRPPKGRQPVANHRSRRLIQRNPHRIDSSLIKRLPPSCPGPALLCRALALPLLRCRLTILALLSRQLSPANGSYRRLDAVF